MTVVLDPRDHHPQDFLKLSSSLGISEQNSRRLFSAVVGHGSVSPSDWAARRILTKQLSKSVLPLPSLVLEDSTRSSIDGFEKLLFRTHDALPIESVIIPLERPGSATVCISSQVGCVMGCTFCATARMSSRRNLATWEIVDQVVQARRLAELRGLSIKGAVFMGMGEPFLNYERVITAAKILSFPAHRAISGKAITISTVGVLDKIFRYTNEDHPFRLSISLGAATDEKRQVLVPVAARTPVREIISAAKNYALAKKTRINLAYVCVGGINVTNDDARALGELLLGVPARIDLITVTDPTGRFVPPSDTELNLFRDALRVYVGQPVVRRYSGGADINAACGTLAGKSVHPIRPDQLP